MKSMSKIYFLLLFSSLFVFHNCDDICDENHCSSDGFACYDKDPTKFSDAKFIKTISYQEIINKKLQIMDLSAVELIKDANIEIRIFSMSDPENFIKVAMGDTLGTTCKKGE